jgi:heme/copper-type cytochrome/quinol oxidase subunit 3
MGTRAAADVEPAIDVSGLPPYAFGHRSVIWWGTFGMIAIESTVFALGIAAYYYLRSHTPEWPPAPLAPPELRWGTLNTAIMLVSCIPNLLYQRAARRFDLGRTRLWLLVALVLAIAFVVVRWVEFTTLNCRWSASAYGSIVYFLMGLHTTHLVTDLLDSLVLAALFWSSKIEAKRFVDLSENADYWYFVVLAWLPIYATIYWAPRLLR